MLVTKLSGNTKFELDTKLTGEQFHRFILFVVEDPENEARFSQMLGIFERAAQEDSPFAVDQENELYKGILQKMRDFNPNEEGEKEGA